MLDKDRLMIMKTKGTLTLIPTPLSDDSPLEQRAFDLLNQAALDPEFQLKSVFVIEDLKPGRKRWLGFKLPRVTVDHFFLYNEHTAKAAVIDLLKELESGKNVFLMSDGGLPAFYDPGSELVRLCHQHHIKVTSTPFCNSVVLALALSGMSHQKFWFEGFLPMESSDRINVLKKLLQQNQTSIVMDTPYRMKRVLEELNELWTSGIAQRKKIFLAMDLNAETEELCLGTPSELLKAINEFKREFILIVSE